MSNIFFSSDWHFFHKKIAEYCPHSRKGDTPEQMTDMILSNIRDQTVPGDILYNLGDVSFGTFGQTRDALKSIQKMQISHHLILGNHDRRIRSSSELRSLFSTVKDMDSLKIQSNNFVLCHFPMATWDRKNYGSIHLHGHTHGGFVQPGKCMDVGIDTRTSGDMKMWSLEEILKIMSFEKTGYDYH